MIVETLVKLSWLSGFILIESYTTPRASSSLYLAVSYRRERLKASLIN
jgi:hypothetical protein